MAFFTSAQDFLVLNDQLLQKSNVQEPFISRAKAPPVKRSEKALGTRMRLIDSWF